MLERRRRQGRSGQRLQSGSSELPYRRKRAWRAHMIPSAGAGFVYACANYTYPRTLACPRLKDRPSKFNLPSSDQSEGGSTPTSDASTAKCRGCGVWRPVRMPATDCRDNPVAPMMSASLQVLSRTSTVPTNH
jgi:hypothetical protein